MASESQDNFREILLSSLDVYSKAAAKMAGAMFDRPSQIEPAVLLNEGIKSEGNFYVSIFFTGLVYGEYVLAMREETAAALIGQSLENKQGAELTQVRQELIDAFCEYQNMVVGQSIVSLNQIYQKLTITTPRVYFGAAKYPRLLVGKTDLVTPGGTIECFLYVDRMKLDIASSYKDALAKVLVAHDHLKAAMSKLKEQQSFLVHSEKMAALGTMAGGIAHEINTPLAAITLLGGSLRKIQVEDEANRRKLFKGLDDIQNVVNKITKITHGMGDFAHALRREKPSFSPVDQIIRNSVNICEQLLEREQIKLNTQISNLDLQIECRAPDIAQVVLALVTNAREAVRQLPNRWITIDVMDCGDFVSIRITDAGTGIDPKVRKNIFDPFFTTKDFGRGPGLGLSMAKGIVDAHNGRIFVDEKSKNTCFVVELPKIADLAATGS